jgi:hypothetical protein
MLVGVSGKPDLEGGAMEAIETLKREHRIVDQVCEACRRELDRADDTGVLDPIEMERFVEFFRFYANACHDPKECSTTGASRGRRTRSPTSSASTRRCA